MTNKQKPDGYRSLIDSTVSRGALEALSVELLEQTSKIRREVGEITYEVVKGSDIKKMIAQYWARSSSMFEYCLALAEEIEKIKSRGGR